MRAMTIDRFGGPEVMHMADIEMPQPGPEEVVIKLAYAGVNPVDWKCREGWLSRFFDYKFPFVVGFAGSGIVSAIGSDVLEFQVGDRVVTSSNQGKGENGTYAEYVKSSARRVAHLSDAVDFAVGASIPTAAVTSWEAVFGTGAVKAGQHVLINGGAGGMGSFAIQFAKYAGARVAATCGPKNLDYIRQLGADLAIDYRAQNVREAVLQWVPEGVDLLIDLVGQGTILDGVHMVKQGGRIVPIATLIDDEPSWDKAVATSREIRIIPTMSNSTLAGEQLRTIVDLYNRGLLRPPAIEVLPLAEAGEAHRRVREGHVRGKIVLKVADL